MVPAPVNPQTKFTAMHNCTVKRTATCDKQVPPKENNIDISE